VLVLAVGRIFTINVVLAVNVVTVAAAEGDAAELPQGSGGNSNISAYAEVRQIAGHDRRADRLLALT